MTAVDGHRTADVGPGGTPAPRTTGEATRPQRWTVTRDEGKPGWRVKLDGEELVAIVAREDDARFLVRYLSIVGRPWWRDGD